MGTQRHRAAQKLLHPGGSGLGLYRTGEFAEALDTINEALSSGVMDAQLFFQAGMIHQAANATGKGREYLRMAAEINARYQNFHVHR